jgi:hypothetical protein
MGRHPLLAAIVAAVLAFAACSSSPQASIILKNAAIYTMEPTQLWAKAVAIADNRILRN